MTMKGNAGLLELRRTELHAALASFLIVFAVLFWSATPLGAAEVYLGRPTVGENRVDICLQWGSGCDGEAAEAYCKSLGYDRMVSWEPDNDIGADHPTIVIGSGQVCADAYCDGYLSVTCALEDEWTQSTGNGGVVAELVSKSGQSPEGILLIAVAEHDVHMTMATIVDSHGLALLHTPPGAYRLFINDYKNTVPIRPQPAYPLDVEGGSTGNFVTIDIE